jgi:hypothetical protein
MNKIEELSEGDFTQSEAGSESGYEFGKKTKNRDFGAVNPEM